jgi:hypothetical protein
VTAATCCPGQTSCTTTQKHLFVPWNFVFKRTFTSVIWIIKTCFSLISISAAILLALIGVKRTASRLPVLYNIISQLNHTFWSYSVMPVTRCPCTSHTHVRSLTTLTRSENASLAARCFTMSEEQLNRSCLWHSFWIKSNGDRNVRYVVRNASWYRKSGKSQSLYAYPTTEQEMQSVEDQNMGVKDVT